MHRPPHVIMHGDMSDTAESCRRIVAAPRMISAVAPIENGAAFTPLHSQTSNFPQCGDGIVIRGNGRNVEPEQVDGEAP